ncbi:MAG TPA: FAD-dependent oxidoreductase [Dehalococcoidia bacterium]|nr:FAD-dependent oxidoreductase [Dehalococcoidia bacterium]
MYDLIIIGGGPAGTTAAVYAARKRLNTLLLSKDLGGQVNLTLGIENYMGFQYVEGPELMTKFEQQMKQFPIDIKTGITATALSTKAGVFDVTAEDGQTYQANAVILATGKKPRSLDVPGENMLIGRGVSYCAICDGPLFSGQTVAVVGGGNSALEAVRDMVKIAAHVHLISTTPLTADAIMVERAEEAKNLSMFIQYQVQEILGTDSVEVIVIKSLKTGAAETLKVAGVFVEIGLVPNSAIAKGLTRLNPAGEIETNCKCETDVPGLFAAGDVTDVPEKQIVVAAGEGAKAALQAHRYLQRL